MDDVWEPQLMENLKKYKIVSVISGYNHCYCCTECGKHFMWGNNSYKPCIVDNEEVTSSNLVVPMRIDEVMREKYDVKEIVSVHPGYYNTKLRVRL